jgi:hypothetical protein
MSPGRPRSVPPGADLAVAGRGRAVMRQLSEQWRSPRGLGPPLLRQVLVTGRDSIAQTFTVDLGGDDPELPMPVTGCLRLPPYVPRMGDVAWAWQNGSDFLLVGATANTFGLALRLPGAKLRATNTQVTASTAAEKFLFSGASTVEWEDERDENGLGCGDLAGSRLVCRFPGLYQVGYRGGGTASGSRRIVDARLNAAVIDRWTKQPQPASPAPEIWQSGGVLAAPRLLVVGDVLELFIQTPEAAGGALFGGAGQGQGMELWMRYLP